MSWISRSSASASARACRASRARRPAAGAMRCRRSAPPRTESWDHRREHQQENVIPELHPASVPTTKMGGPEMAPRSSSEGATPPRTPPANVRSAPAQPGRSSKPTGSAPPRPRPRTYLSARRDARLDPPAAPRWPATRHAAASLSSDSGAARPVRSTTARSTQLSTPSSTTAASQRVVEIAGRRHEVGDEVDRRQEIHGGGGPARSSPRARTGSVAEARDDGTTSGSARSRPFTGRLAARTRCGWRTHHRRASRATRCGCARPSLPGLSATSSLTSLTANRSSAPATCGRIEHGRQKGHAVATVGGRPVASNSSVRMMFTRLAD